MKLRSAPPGYFFQPERPPPRTDPFAAPTGPYFFYGTLSDPCRINYTDKNEPVDDFGHVFRFVGNVRDLSDGTFDLGTWLKRMKRDVK
ncbi:hypothetical protein ASPZODRAFT_2065001 [Penicilliopsis zonata CBS 506.65]|uniref:Gamma-glutamylcyclotransferase AIG2-like domain-containing protein n=1 Tax=Penicilliopsis zonata CBS 506.65 TaxID=1073090 RepID=A0A1L9SG98_9EURO|nr:hypothetical protein ASPZODRAFT_2065001 [Penicilliopsis zonata CBS 506.65]OJJ46143.1 hypothetical protein ASPZODRAFT_2065001 [Penicilliopsis zonata CBS 506.65]